MRAAAFPIGAAVTLEQLDADPHPVLARLREHEPVSWLPALDGWLVTRRDLAMQVMRDADSFTVDDPRFSTGQVVGPSMLTLDGPEHTRHRAPFAEPFRLGAVRERFTGPVREETDRLIDAVARGDSAELRRELAGPLAAAVVTHALGLEHAGTAEVLGWYDAIVDSVTEITAGRGPTEAGRRGFEALRAAMEPALESAPETSLVAAAAGSTGGLGRDEVVSNAAVMLFGGIETTEGMIANAVAHLLAHPAQLAAVRAEPAGLANAIEESLRLEPAAAVVDRYATRDVELAGARIGARELVVVSIAGANRDPAIFPDPDRFDARRPNAKLHAAFAHGPHVCIGMHLARLEAHTAVARLLERLPGLRLDPDAAAAARGLVFRKPDAVRVRWDAPEDPA
jgi:cytochrome P450